jgi:hypothetical protein
MPTIPALLSVSRGLIRAGNKMQHAYKAKVCPSGQRGRAQRTDNTKGTMDFVRGILFPLHWRSSNIPTQFAIVHGDGRKSKRGRRRGCVANTEPTTAATLKHRAEALWAKMFVVGERNSTSHQNVKRRERLQKNPSSPGSSNQTNTFGSRETRRGWSKG